MIRTHTCGEIGKDHIGQEVTLTGWVQTRRDHGGIIFIDLRDRYGITQVTFDPEQSKDAWAVADKARSEWVLKVTGKVIARPDAMVNDKIETGAIEIEAGTLEVLNEAKTPPFEINDPENKVNEDIRLKYRYLDLRNDWLIDRMHKRAELMHYIRGHMHGKGFTEVQTPILANSSPEGARDFLVPSRLHPGKFYALPQAPQQFKQLLMVGGFDKYYQIAPCFRDEDPRADRHSGAFYQLDLEMSFVEQEDIWNLVEGLMKEITQEFSDKELVFDPFLRMTWDEAMNTYGSDKPDLRYDIKIVDVSDVFAQSEFKVFADALGKGGVIKAMRVPGGMSFSRKDIDELTEVARQKGAKGLAYIQYDEEVKSPILKFMSEQEIEGITQGVGAQKGDIVFFGADDWKTVVDSLGAVRNEVGVRLELKDPKKAAWVWVHDFPMFELNDEGKVDFSHNPFSMPQGGVEVLDGTDEELLQVVAYQYDLVFNGYEVASGAIRNHRPDIMYKAFERVGYTREKVDKDFGHMIKAFEYGAPPHGGIAPGLDRLMMVLWEIPNIRDMYAFPKTGQNVDAMLGTPSEVSEEQLAELGIRIDKRSE
jgi:aspartyl-tRNA synthetase